MSDLALEQLGRIARGDDVGYSPYAHFALRWSTVWETGIGCDRTDPFARRITGSSVLSDGSEWRGAKLQSGVALSLLAIVVILAVAHWDATPCLMLVAVDAALFLLAAWRLRRSSSPYRLDGWAKLVTAMAGGITLLAIAVIALDHLVEPWGTISHSKSVAIGKLASGFVALASAFTVLYVSSVIDGVYVRPYLRGSKPDRHMPCLAPPEEDWKPVTRIWLLHRLLAWVAMIIGGATFFMFMISIWIPGVGNSTLAAVAAVATVLAGFYISRVAPAIAFLLNPPLFVGDVVTLADEFSSDGESTYYVIDVAMEGFKLAYLAPATGHASDQAHDLAAGSDQAIKDQRRYKHDRILDLADVSRLLRRRQAYNPCEHGCARFYDQCPQPALDAAEVGSQPSGGGA